LSLELLFEFYLTEGMGSLRFRLAEMDDRDGTHCLIEMVDHILDDELKLLAKAGRG